MGLSTSSPSACAMEPTNIPRRGRRVLWLGVILAIMFGAFWDAYPLPDAIARLNQIPRRGPQFEGSDIALGKKERVVLGKVALIHRLYVWKGGEFYLTMIDGTRDRHAVHDPRYCFEGVGWHIQEERQLLLPEGEATWFKMTRGEDKAEAVFWFSDGESRYSSLPRYWWKRTLRRLTLGRHGIEPLMIVLQSYGADQPDWPSLAKELVASLGL